MIDGGSSAFYAFFIIILLGLLFTIFYLNISTSIRVGKGKNVTVVNNNFAPCYTPIGNLPEIPKKQCEFANGDMKYYYDAFILSGADSIPKPGSSPPANIPALRFEFLISPNPVYYRTVCAGLCDEVTPQGDCLKNGVEDPEDYQYCLQILEPPADCTNTATALGYLEDTTIRYYASGIKSIFCVDEN